MLKNFFERCTGSNLDSFDKLIDECFGTAIYLCTDLHRFISSSMRGKSAIFVHCSWIFQFPSMEMSSRRQCITSYFWFSSFYRNHTKQPIAYSQLLCLHCLCNDDHAGYWDKPPPQKKTKQTLEMRCFLSNAAIATYYYTLKPPFKRISAFPVQTLLNHLCDKIPLIRFYEAPMRTKLLFRKYLFNIVIRVPN